MDSYEGNFQRIKELYDVRVSRRLEYLQAITCTVFDAEDKKYRKDSESDAFVAISTLGIISTELENLVQEMSFMSDILTELQQQSKESYGQRKTA